jgi:RNA polymerase sigma-54 factor
MALATRLEIRQGQSLVITPQLQQAIKLLQLSNLELEAYVEGELERNPLLEREGAEPAEAEPDVGPVAAETELSLGDEAPGAAEADLDVRHDDVYDASPGDQATGDAADPGAGPGLTDWSKAGKGGSFDGDDDMEQALAREKTLSEHLQDQLMLAGLDAGERLIGAALIDGSTRAATSAPSWPRSLIAWACRSRSAKRC